jgi:hypothetical protein
MAIERKRGCGYRKVGGLYLVSGRGGRQCDRLPIKLDVCPVCSHGFKQSRGFTWVDLFGLVGGDHEDVLSQAILPSHCDCKPDCPLCWKVREIGKAGLLWIGEKFYKNPGEFMAEGFELGFSRRIKALPRNFKVGESWILLAHPKTIREYVKAEQGDEKIGLLPGVDEKIVFKPGIFTLWRPVKIEQLFNESQQGSDEVEEAIEKGITPIFVPDNDPDHHGSVYDKAEEEAAEEEPKETGIE